MTGQLKEIPNDTNSDMCSAIVSLNNAINIKKESYKKADNFHVICIAPLISTMRLSVKLCDDI